MDILLGGFHFRTTKEELIRGYNLVRLPGDATLTNPVKIKVINGELFVSWILFDLEDRSIVRITDNEWDVKNAIPYRSNHDASGFELVDAYEIIKLQVDIIDNATIRVAGFFKTSTGYLFTTQNGFGLMGPSRYPIDSNEKRRLKKISDGIKDMFKYPKLHHFGVRAPKEIIEPDKGHLDTTWLLGNIPRIVKKIQVYVFNNDEESLDDANEAINFLKGKGYTITNESPRNIPFVVPVDKI